MPPPAPIVPLSAPQGSPQTSHALSLAPVLGVALSPFHSTATIPDQTPTSDLDQFIPEASYCPHGRGWGRDRDSSTSSLPSSLSFWVWCSSHSFCYHLGTLSWICLPGPSQPAASSSHPPAQNLAQCLTYSGCAAFFFFFLFCPTLHLLTLPCPCPAAWPATHPARNLLAVLDPLAR